ncbi:MAG TPA: hypothetical protein PLB02_05375 [Thermoanaerobaculia bacterium]|nr:hypothetical protein [Thermoanaerobaculia bacterium]HQR66805.1 hypothetical protein [Thermoanaerobaculia bacterium]
MSPAVSTYPVEVPRTARLLGLAALGLLAAAGLVLLSLALSSPTSPAWLLAFALVWLAATGLLGAQLLSLPTRVELGGDGVLRFVCPTRIVRVPLSTIRAIRPGPAGLILVVHDRGTLRLPGRPKGLEDLLTRVRAASTRAVVVGL